MPHPNPLTAEELARITGRDTAEDLEAFSAALAEMDQDAAFQAARDALTARVWDQASPVNGNSAARVLEFIQVPAGGAVILVDRGRNTVVLQPFRPDRPGMEPIPAEEAQAIADAMADNMASETARGEALNQLPPQILGGTEEPGQGDDGDDGADPALTVEELAARVDAQGEELRLTQETLDAVVNMIVEGF